MTPDTYAQLLSEADCLYDQSSVDQAIKTLGEQITADLQTRNPLVYCVLTGAMVFAGQLLPHLPFPLELSYLHATRYRGATRGGEIKWIANPPVSPNQRHVLILDDILDEGSTLVAIEDACRKMGALSVRTAVLVHKNHERKARANMRCTYTGLEVPDRYVFGCGMDYHEYLRNAPGIYAIAEGFDGH